MKLRKRSSAFIVIAAHVSLLLYLYRISNAPVPNSITPDEVPTAVIKNKVTETILYDRVPNLVLKDEVPAIIPGSSSQTCSSQTNIMFAKTHKTASSTIQNVLFRFALKYGAIVAMPRTLETFYFKKFNRKFLFPLKPGYQYNIFAHHSIFDYQEMRAVMPDNTAFITVLRDPVALFESAYSYFRLKKSYGMDISAFALLNGSEPGVEKLQNRRMYNRFGRNQQAFDLGLIPELFDDEAAILKKIEELDRQIDLAMITGTFLDQSLVLLKDELCWNDFRDIVSLELNARKPTRRVELSEEVRDNLRRINRADQLIYDHFYKKLSRRLENFGSERMKTELEKLELAKGEVARMCVQDGSLSETALKMSNAKDDKFCANLLRIGHNFSVGILEEQKRFYDITQAQFDDFKSASTAQMLKLLDDPAFDFLIRDLGFAESE